MTQTETTSKIIAADASCIDCDGTGIDVVFGDVCHCATVATKAERPAVDRIVGEAVTADAGFAAPTAPMYDMKSASVAECAACGGPMAVGKPCPMCEIKKAGETIKAVKEGFATFTEASAAAVEAVDELKAVTKKRLTPAEHIAVEKGKKLDGCYLDGGKQVEIGMRVETIRGGKTGVVFCAHAQKAKWWGHSTDDEWSEHYGKIKILLDDGTITTRASHWCRPA